MDHQEWFERFKTKLSFDENRFYGEVWVREEWKIIQSALVKMAIHMLPSLQRKIVNLIFFDGLTERKTAQKLKMDKTKVHRVKTKALKSLARSAFVKLALSPRVLKQRYAI